MDFSRRKLLTGSAALAAYGRLSHEAQAWPSHGVVRVYPEDFYQGGDGADWLPAMIRAQAAGSTIYLGRDHSSYAISSAIPVLSNRTWQGLSPSVALVNPQTAALSANWAAFQLGNIHPAMFNTGGNKLPTYATSNIAVNATTIQLTTAGDYVNFSIGQFVAVQSTSQYSPGDGYNYPDYCQFTYITNITSGGLISLADPILYAITGACISPIGSTTDAYTGQPWALVQNVTINSITCNAYAPLWTRTGAYNCKIKNIAAVNANSLLVVDALVKCSIDGITGPFTVNMIEVACYSQNTTVANVVGTLTGLGSVGYTPIQVHEQSNNITLNNCSLTLSSSLTANNSAMTLACFDTTVNNLMINDQTTVPGQSLVTVPSYGTPIADYPPNNINIVGGSFACSTSRVLNFYIGGFSGTAPSNVIVNGSTLTGVTTNGNSMGFANVGSGCVVENCALRGGIGVLAGATPTETNNTVT